MPLTRSLVGRLSATRSADVRARVAGVLLKRLYKEGSDVKEGQPLFQIDPAPLRAALEGAQAQLAQAEAQATNAHIAAQRARELHRERPGVALGPGQRGSQPSVRPRPPCSRRAPASATARINLGYASVTAPLRGAPGNRE